MDKRIVIIDYGMGNVGSIQNMLKKIGYSSLVSANKDEIERADKLVLPGVGAFDAGVENLESLGLRDLLNELVVRRKKHILGICLGMQLFSKSSEEGKQPGLGFIDARTVRFVFGNELNLKIPHMGWNTVEPKSKSTLFNNFSFAPRFYFVHSYHVLCSHPTDVASTTTHGLVFASAIEHGNIFGVQFHPEKSHQFGMALLKNYVEFPC